jgi:exonuclease III
MDEQITVNKLNPVYGWWNARNGSWSWRAGARISF